MLCVLLSVLINEYHNRSKQEAHRPHRSPDKQFQSINKFAQSYIDKEKNTIIFCSFENLSLLHIGYFMPRLVEIDPEGVKKKIYKFQTCIFYIALLSSLGKGWGPSFEQLESPLPNNAMCQVSQWIWRIFSNLNVNAFSLFRNYPRLGKSVLYFEQNSISFI